MYNGMYAYAYNPQTAKDRIDNQIAQLQQMKEQLPQMPVQNQPAINQTFQLANNTGIRYVDTIEDVKKDIVFTDTPYFSKDLSVLWFKTSKGDIKSYELTEIVQKDEKDLLIESLQYQIDELKKGIDKNAKSNDSDANESTKGKESTSISNSKPSNAKSK